MKDKTVMVLAVGDGAISIVEHNKDLLSDKIEVATVRVLKGNAATVYDSEYWYKALSLVVPQNIIAICVLNCLGGDATDSILPICKAVSEFEHVTYLDGFFVNPFSFEGNSRLQNAQMKLCILEDEEFYSPKSMEIMTFDNDNIFKEFPNMPFHIALDHFNKTICREIACQYSEIL